MFGTKIMLGIGALVTTLALGVGTVAAAGPRLATAVGVGRDSQARCEAFQAQFAQNLGITMQKLQDTRKLTANQLIDQQLAAGKITADQAQKLHDRVNSSVACQKAGQVKQAVVRVTKVELQAVAQKLQVTEKDLVKELRGGKSLAQVAQAHNVSRDDLKATMRTAFKGELDTAVKNGKLTQAQADKALAAFDARIDTVIDRVGWGKGR